MNFADPSGMTTCDANGNNCYDSVTVTAGGGGGGWGGGGTGPVIHCTFGVTFGTRFMACNDPNNGRGNSSTLDDRANALANALNKTGVQSLGNPCTVALFYGSSASAAVSFGGSAAGAAVFPELNAAITAFKATAVGKLLPWAAAGSAAAKFAHLFDRASDAVQKGCDALQ